MPFQYKFGDPFVASSSDFSMNHCVFKNAKTLQRKKLQAGPCKVSVGPKGAQASPLFKCWKQNHACHRQAILRFVGFLSSWRGSILLNLPHSCLSKCSCCSSFPDLMFSVSFVYPSLLCLGGWMLRTQFVGLYFSCVFVASSLVPSYRCFALLLFSRVIEVLLAFL